MTVLSGGAVAHERTASQSSSDVAVAVASGKIERGDRGSAVAAVQRRVGVGVDRVFGPATERAVKRFQRRKGLTVDGVVGPATASALGLRLTTRSGSAGRGRSLSGVGSSTAAKLRRIAACESGGNPRAISPNGRYRGKYQFSRATWRAVGGTGDPAKASEREQDRRAAALLARAGTSPWPNCA